MALYLARDLVMDLLSLVYGFMEVTTAVVLSAKKQTPDASGRSD